MEATQAIAIVATAPFRALIAAANAVARAKGRAGIGFDPNRAGGKAAVVQRLCAELGAEAIAAELTKASGEHSQGGQGTTEATQGEEQGEGGESHGDASVPASTQGEGDAEGAAGEGKAPTDGPSDSGDAEGEAPEGDGPKGEGKGGEGDAGEQSQGEGDKGEGDEAPEPPALPPPPPEGQTPGPDPLSQQVYAIAQRAASEAVTPLRDYIGGPLAEYIEQATKWGYRAAARGPHNAPFTALPGHPLPDAPAAVAHPLTRKLLALVSQGEQVLLVGPAGTGKTTAARAVAAALGRRFGMLSLSGGVSESSLTGWLLPIGEGGRFSYVPSDFVACYGGNAPALFLFDEMDAADPSVAVQVNSALANGVFAVPQRYEAPMIERGDCAVIGAANTMGDGAGSGAYSARGALDAATLDRFYVLEWPADVAFERALLLGDTLPAQWTPAHDWTALSAKARATADANAVKWVHDVRAKAAETGVDRVVSVRMAQRFQRALRAGIGANEAKRDLLAPWSADERARLGTLAPAK